MTSDIKKARALIHDLSNRMTVVNKAFEIFSKHLPSHRLTTMGLESLENAILIIKDLKEVFTSLERQCRSSVISTAELSSYINSQKIMFEEMCAMNLEIDVSDSGNGQIEIPKEEISKLFGLFLEDSALAGSTEVKVQIHATDSIFRISLNDNGDGSISKDGENFIKIQETLNQFAATSNLRSISNIGSSLIIDLPFQNNA